MPHQTHLHEVHRRWQGEPVVLKGIRQGLVVPTVEEAIRTVRFWLGTFVELGEAGVISTNWYITPPHDAAEFRIYPLNSTQDKNREGKWYWRIVVIDLLEVGEKVFSDMPVHGVDPGPITIKAKTVGQVRQQVDDKTYDVIFPGRISDQIVRVERWKLKRAPKE
jgi:hypothetical protein